MHCALSKYFVIFYCSRSHHLFVWFCRFRRLHAVNRRSVLSSCTHTVCTTWIHWQKRIIGVINCTEKKILRLSRPICATTKASDKGITAKTGMNRHTQKLHDSAYACDGCVHASNGRLIDLRVMRNIRIEFSEFRCQSRNQV